MTASTPDTHVRSRPSRRRGLPSTARLLLVGAIVLMGACGNPQPHVFILNIDMLRADHLSLYGYHRETTPHLDELARRGVWFRRAYAHAPWTFASVASLLTGLYPTSHGATYARDSSRYITTQVSEDLVTLPELFHAHGYETAAFVANPLLKRRSGLGQGFDVYRDEFVREWTKGGGAAGWWMSSMSATNLDAAALAWLDETRPEHAFVYLHYIDVHGPYLEPKPWGRPPGSVTPARAEAARTTGRLPDVMVDVYDGALHELDAEIARFLEALDERGILERSIVVITADHGEEFGDHGSFGHGHTLYEEQLHVPLLMVRTDAFPHTRAVGDVVGQVDVLPTLATLAGIACSAVRPGRDVSAAFTPGDALRAGPLLFEMHNQGRPLWNAPPNAPPVEYGLLQPPAQKYVVARRTELSDALDEHVSVRFHDLDRDPGERVAHADDVDPELLDRTLRALVAEARARHRAPGTVVIDAETEQQLRDLGYVP